MTEDPRERPRLLIVAGPNGAGKTTITDAGLAHKWFQGCEYINPDVIAQQEFGNWNDPESVLKAARLATERREACLRENRSVAFETVFSTREKVEFVNRGIEAGFFVRLFFVGTDGPEINASRVARRMLQGGHEVPLQKILNRWSRSILSCAEVARRVHRLYIYDNSLEDAPARLILRASSGTIVRSYAPGRDWMNPIVAELSTSIG
ncbi:MAG: zeta toxin family protein [Isosphaeraceae bacterium]